MADPSSTGPDALEETLGRLSKKPGVKACIALDRSTGAIIKYTGQISVIRAAKKPTATSTSTNGAPAAPFEEGNSTSEGGIQDSETRNAEELAALVWAFVSAAGGLVEEIDSEDELKLLRLRTRKHELVIVPDVKYMLIMIHDTPPA